MENCTPVTTPAESTRLVSRSFSGEEATAENYSQLVGGLLFALITRADLPFSVGQLSRFMSSPGQSHWLAALRVLRYLQGTKSRRLKLGAISEDNVIYADTDFAGDPEHRRSTGGVLTLFLGSAVAWSSRLQRGTKLSSCEAEYVNLTPATQQALWYQKFLNDFKLGGTAGVLVKEDNQAAIALSKDSGRFHERTKHIDVRHHFIKQHVEVGAVLLQYCDTRDMLADIYTKPLARHIFARLRDMILNDI